MTATPQKLRLMLIEGAIRFARQAIAGWEQQDPERAVESLGRCRNVISELLSGIRPDQSTLTRKVAGVYLFLFRTVTEAQLQRDVKKVQETISVLEVERDTWRMVCEKLPGMPISDSAPSESRVEIIAPSHGIDGPAASAFMADA